MISTSAPHGDFAALSCFAVRIAAIARRRLPLA
jgi:hypothetical protein